MNTKKTYSSIAIGSLAVICILFASSGSRLFASNLAETGGAQDSAAIAKAAQDLRLVQNGYNAGINTANDVSRADIVLATAKFESAVESNQTSIAQKALATIAADRQQLFDATNRQWTAGAVSQDIVLQDELALAQAKTRIELYNVVILRQQYLSLVQKRSSLGDASSKDLKKAQAAYQSAKTMFAESGDN
jgi:outer membrane protein TolC